MKRPPNEHFKTVCHEHPYHADPPYTIAVDTNSKSLCYAVKKELYCFDYDIAYDCGKPIFASAGASLSAVTLAKWPSSK
ncbi:hypothetical protein QOT17_024704 [Balamuthia mandrillaris]